MNFSFSLSQNNDLNPIWNEHFEFIVEDASTQHLVVKIFDDEGLQASELIGCAHVKLSELQPGKVKDIWLKLVKDLDVQRDNKNRGQVRMFTTLLLKWITKNYKRELHLPLRSYGHWVTFCSSLHCRFAILSFCQ